MEFAWSGVVFRFVDLVFGLVFTCLGVFGNLGFLELLLCCLGELGLRVLVFVLLVVL